MGSCEIINPEEQIPSFVYIEPFEFETVTGEGTADQILPIVEILSGELNLGIHSIPNRIPLLLEGTHTLDLFPGISDNGIAGFPNIYNMLQFDQVTVDLVPGQVDTIRPQSRYKENLIFAIQEPFENSFQVFQEDGDQDPATRIDLDQTEVFEGNSSGRITINEDHPVFEVLSGQIDVFPPKSTFVYLEMNYKTESVFGVGVYWTTSDGTRSASLVNFINPKDEWNKIYINLSDIFDFLATQTDVINWQLGINAQMPIENEEFVGEEKNIWVDNIKLIHFEL